MHTFFLKKKLLLSKTFDRLKSIILYVPVATLKESTRQLRVIVHDKNCEEGIIEVQLFPLVLRSLSSFLFRRKLPHLLLMKTTKVGDKYSRLSVYFSQHLQWHKPALSSLFYL